MLAAAEFARLYPKSAISARLVLTLDSNEQRDLVVSLIDDAVYCESWEAYFEFAERSNVIITEDVAMAAVQAVGLDPLSAPLWIKAALCCETPDARRSVFEFGLSVPLYGWRRLFAVYREHCPIHEENQHDLSEADCERVATVLAAETWPDRYARLDTDGEAEEVRQAYDRLIEAMLATLETPAIAQELQMRRIELAMRQMCTQLPGDDSCWYQYALFQLRLLEDAEGAKKTLSSALPSAGSSLALESLSSVVDGALGASSGDAEPGTLSAVAVLVWQRRAAEDLVAGGVSKDRIRALRAAGKAAAQQGLGDWKIFSQWRCAEDVAARDSKMAERVFENGMICCSHSPSDAVLLGSEAAQYHLLLRHERETLGYAEQQIEQQSSLHHRGRIMASWNNLVRIESLLGLSFSKAAKRRGEAFPQSRITTFMEHCRVGDYLPCSRRTFQWVRFAEDFNVDKASVEETPFHGVVPPRNAGMATKRPRAVDCETPDDSVWDEYVAPPNCLPSPDEENPDEVTGARELRGKLVYRVKVDARTAARCRREERTRQRSRAGEEAAERGGALGVLLRRVRSLSVSPVQTKRLQTISADWLIRVLTAAELDLERTLRERTKQRTTDTEVL